MCVCYAYIYNSIIYMHFIRIVEYYYTFNVLEHKLRPVGIDNARILK